MRIKLFRKILVFGIILTFVTISTLTSVTSDSYNAESTINPILVKDSQPNLNNDYSKEMELYDSEKSNINPILVKDTQSYLQNNYSYEIIWCGNALAEFESLFEINLTVNGGSSYVKDINITETDLILVFLYKTEISVSYNPSFFRRAYYDIVANINDINRGDDSAMKLDEVDTKSNILGMGYLLENACNTTVEIKVTITVSTFFAPPESHDFTVSLNIICP